MRVQGTCIVMIVAVPKARAWHLAQRPEYKPACEKSSRNRQALRGTVHPPWDTLVKAVAACLHIWARRPSDGRELIGGCLCMRRLLIWRRDLARPWKAKALETPPDMQRPRSTRGPSSPSSAQLPQLPHNISALRLGRQGGTSCPITPSRPSPESRAGHGGKVFGCTSTDLGDLRPPPGEGDGAPGNANWPSRLPHCTQRTLSWVPKIDLTSVKRPSIVELPKPPKCDLGFWDIIRHLKFCQLLNAMCRTWPSPEVDENRYLSTTRVLAERCFALLPTERR